MPQTDVTDKIVSSSSHSPSTSPATPHAKHPRQTWKKRVRQWLLRCLFRAQLLTLRVIPWKLSLALGEGMGLIAFCCSKRYRQVAESNLTLAYGDTLTGSERRHITRRVFQNFARAMLIEWLKVPSLTIDQVRTLIRVETLDPLTQALAKGKGVIVVSGHLGNWELLARRVAMEGFPVTVVTRQSEDSQFNAITDRLRENAGYTVHPRGSSPRRLLKHLRQNGIVAILCDQKSDDVFVPFFGRTAGTTAGPAVLALKTGAAILPLFYPRQADGKFRAVFLPEIDTTPTGDTPADTQRIMADITSSIESVVREYPDQWLWLHDRWRMPKQPRPEC